MDKQKYIAILDFTSGKKFIRPVVANKTMVETTNYWIDKLKLDKSKCIPCIVK